MLASVAEYRDERETLRRRVQELERELDEDHGDLRIELETVRRERDDLRFRLETRTESSTDLQEELHATRRERDALQERVVELERVISKHEADPSYASLMRLLRIVFTTVVGAAPGILAGAVIDSPAVMFVGGAAGAVLGL